MVYTPVKESVDVLVAFQKQKPKPMMFKWGKRYYQVDKVNLVHTERVGREKIYYFSVSDKTHAFRLAFSTESMQWHLEEMCVL